MKLGTKSILATTIATALFSTVATAAAAPTTGPYVEISGAADYPSWEVSSEKLQALSGDYTFENDGGTNSGTENNATLAYKTDIDLNDGDKITFNFDTTALVKGADYELVVVTLPAPAPVPAPSYAAGDIVGVRISAVDTTNGVSSVRVRIANAGATGISAGTVLALVEAGTTVDGTDLGNLTITAPTGTWTNSACLTVTATDDCTNSTTVSDDFVFPSKHDGHSHDDNGIHRGNKKKDNHKDHGKHKSEGKRKKH